MVLRFQKTPPGRKLETKGNETGNKSVSTQPFIVDRRRRWKQPRVAMGNEEGRKRCFLVS